MNRLQIRVTGAALTALLLVSMEAHAFNFTPTEAEWATWPEMCKARYSRTRIGTGSDFGASVPQSVVQQWEANLGPGWNYVHHHCAGMIYLDRAKLESNPSQRKFLLGKSISEHSFALEHAFRQAARRRDPRMGLTYRERRPPQGARAIRCGAQGQCRVWRLRRRWWIATRSTSIPRSPRCARATATSGQSAEISHFSAAAAAGHYEESLPSPARRTPTVIRYPACATDSRRPDIR